MENAGICAFATMALDHASTQTTVLRSRQDGQTSEGFEANMHSWNLTSCRNCTAQPRSIAAAGNHLGVGARQSARALSF